MKVEDTYVCLGCEEVFQNNRNGCPGCGDRHYFPLAKWLNRKPLYVLCVGSIEEQRRVIRIIDSIIAKTVNKENLNAPTKLSFDETELLNQIVVSSKSS